MDNYILKSRHNLTKMQYIFLHFEFQSLLLLICGFKLLKVLNVN